jgi:hypothetical protein
MIRTAFRSAGVLAQQAVAARTSGTPLLTVKQMNDIMAAHVDSMKDNKESVSGINK